MALLTQLSTATPLELSTTPPKLSPVLTPLGKLMVPAWVVGLLVLGTAPLIGYCTKLAAAVLPLANSKYRLSATPPLSVMRPSRAEP